MFRDALAPYRRTIRSARSTSSTRTTTPARTTSRVGGWPARQDVDRYRTSCRHPDNICPWRPPSLYMPRWYGQTLVPVLNRCSDNLTRRNGMKGQSERFWRRAWCCWASRSTPRPNDFAPIKRLQMVRFSSASWGTVRADHSRRDILSPKLSTRETPSSGAAAASKITNSAVSPRTCAHRIEWSFGRKRVLGLRFQRAIDANTGVRACVS
jgi:hypothetical protein